jgi:hypothetical protein
MGLVSPRGPYKLGCNLLHQKYSYKWKMIKAELEPPCSKLANVYRLESLGGGQSYYYGGNNTSGYIYNNPTKAGIH